MAKLTLQQQQKIIVLYEQGKETSKIATQIGCSKTTIRELLKRKDIPKREDNNQTPEYIPTPKEIAEGMEKIKERWSDEVRLKRSGYVEDESWNLPVVTLSAIKRKGRTGA